MTSGQNTSIFRSPRLASGRRPRHDDHSASERSRSPRSRKREPYYSVSTPEQFELTKFAKVANLHAAYRILERDGGHGAGIDHLTFDDFSPGEVFGALRQVSAAILERAYLPYETLSASIPKGDGRFRELSLHRITDRTVAKALQLSLNPFWQSRLPGIGQSVFHVYAKMQQVMRERKAYVLAIDDIKDCFPSAPLEAVLGCHREYITQPDLFWLIERTIRGHEGLNHTTGLDQGSPFSPVAMELLLHTCLDTPLEMRCQGYPLLLRYVDNLTFICNSEHEGHEILKTAATIPSETGLSLKGKDGPPQDIRDPNFNTTVLGLIPKWQEGQLMFKIPEPGYEDLTQGFLNAMNHPRSTEIAKSVAKGWIEAMGPAFTKRATPEVIDRILSIARRCGFRELSGRELQETASGARYRWIRSSESVR